MSALLLSAVPNIFVFLPPLDFEFCFMCSDRTRTDLRSAPLREEDVERFDVAVDDRMVVHVLEREEDLRHPLHNLLQGKSIAQNNLHRHIKQIYIYVSIRSS